MTGNPPTYTDQISGAVSSVTDPAAKATGDALQNYVKKQDPSKPGSLNLSDVVPADWQASIDQNAANVGEAGMFGLAVAGAAKASGSGNVASGLWGAAATYAYKHNILGIAKLGGTSTAHDIETMFAGGGMAKLLLDNIPGLKNLNLGKYIPDIAGVGAVLGVAYLAFKPIIDKHVLTPLANSLSPEPAH